MKICAISSSICPASARTPPTTCCGCAATTATSALDSWCRGKLKRLYPRIRDVDAFARRRYKPFGHFAGLAMWLDLTRDWHEENSQGDQ